MRLIGESIAIKRLRDLKDAYKALVAEDYEHAAKSCGTCKTRGACCLDAHFVNVHISRLEAVAINRIIAELPEERRSRVRARISETIEKFELCDNGDSFARTFACPLFESAVGCLVHEGGKPLPCIQHACYESAADLPPPELLTEQELKVDRLNRRTYGSAQAYMPLPIAIERWR